MFTDKVELNLRQILSRAYKTIYEKTIFSFIYYNPFSIKLL